MKHSLNILFTLLTFVHFAQDFKLVANVSTCKTAIEQKHKSISTLSANFIETSYSSMFNTPKKGSGKLFYKKKDKIRWEHSAPIKQVLLINGKKVKLYENGKSIENAGTKKAVKKIQSLMTQMLSGEFLNEKEFNITYYENKNNYKLVLTPKNERLKHYIKSIDLIFEKSEGLLKEMTMAESDTDKVVYVFSQINTNESVNDSKFTTL